MHAIGAPADRFINTTARSSMTRSVRKGQLYILNQEKANMVNFNVFRITSRLMDGKPQGLKLLRKGASALMV
ncbi:MAG: hypothetical protein EBQ87_00540 [Planctomycetes bacterium]|nr:hypothetical protein [Planctomycetota bacterium]